jgi:signal transduction histidine kinase
VRSSLIARLLLAYMAPTLALVVLAPLLGWAIAQKSLEDEVGRRLEGSASAAAASLKADLVGSLQPGDEGNRTHRNLLARLESLRVALKAERLYAFDPSRRLLVATGAPSPVGTPMPELERDRPEIERALAGEAAASAVTFRGLDGHTYKSGYAPILGPDGRPVAVVGADASAEFFEALRAFGASMALAALACGLLGLALFAAAGRRWILAPVRSLLSSARRIGGGDLASPVPAVGPDELGALARGMDEMRERLLARERELQLMLAGIAHEVRNPLGGIELFAGLLAEELAGDAPKLAHVARIQRELAHLARVVEDFLGYAREPRLEKQRLGSRALLAELRELGRSQAEHKGQTIALEGEEVAVWADAGALRRALLNLLRNALEASPQGGQVRLSAVRRGERVALLVQDDGPGVSEAARERLFTPFFTTKEKGLGLGLALARRIALAHGGAARLEPSAKGARFALELPAEP